VQKQLEELDETLEILIAKCYEELENNITSTPIQIITLALSKLKKQSQQGSGQIVRTQVTFDTGNQQTLPLFPEGFNDN